MGPVAHRCYIFLPIATRGVGPARPACERPVSLVTQCDTACAENKKHAGASGRPIVGACLEAPALKAGDTTIVQPGMAFAVDRGNAFGGVTAGRAGDSVVVTESGRVRLTGSPRQTLVGEA